MFEPQIIAPSATAAPTSSPSSFPLTHRQLQQPQQLRPQQQQQQHNSARLLQQEEDDELAALLLLSQLIQEERCVGKNRTITHSMFRLFIRN